MVGAPTGTCKQQRQALGSGISTTSALKLKTLLQTRCCSIAGAQLLEATQRLSCVQQDFMLTIPSTSALRFPSNMWKRAADQQQVTMGRQCFIVHVS